MRLLLALLGLLTLFGCGERIPEAGGARVLMLGDSMLAANKTVGAGVADALEARLGTEVVDRSVPAARYFYPLPLSGAAGMEIPAQYRPGPWEVVVMNGGGNDLLLGCACAFCAGTLDRLISEDGRRGRIPGFVSDLRQQGARVVYAGYLRNPGTATPIRACRPLGDELDRRIARLAELDAGIVFVPMADLVPEGDASFHALDRIHPSVKGSAAIADRLAEAVTPFLARRANP